MEDDLFSIKKRDSSMELPIAAILDMMVSIIFFLLLSTTYYSLTFQSVPPSQTVTINDPLEPPPRSPRLLVTTSGANITAVLNWSGLEPGVARIKTTLANPMQFDAMFSERLAQIVRQFKTKFPLEKSIQIGFGSDVNYQVMITTLESVTPLIKDVALLSYVETEALGLETAE